MRKMQWLVGRKFGRWEVKKFLGMHPKQRHSLWLCQCICGVKREVQGPSLTSSNSTGCGCLRKEILVRIGKENTTHGLRNHRLYSIWASMKARCCNVRNKNYRYYGGRGIKICDGWKDNFQLFYDYVTILPGYGKKGYSLDRTNNDGNYEPGNVRWATKIQQARNKRSTLMKVFS